MFYFKQIVLMLFMVSGSIAADRNQKIVGGENATIKEIPYQVAYITVNGGPPFCGGSILSETLVVTAAHCVTSDTTKHFIRAGTNKFRTNDGQTVGIKKFIVHENFKPKNSDNDISLIFLKTPLKFGDSVRPIKLPKQEQITPAGTMALASGWGVTSFINKTDPKVLQKVNLPIVDLKICKTANAAVAEVTENMICTGYYGIGGKDACRGDSGGPLVVDSALVGICSWSYQCALPDYPGVFARAAKYVDWIHKQNQLHGSSELLLS